MTPLDPITVRLAGRVLVEASAGTGKTYAISTLYVRLLLERGLDVASILVVTYTRAATAELRDRIRARLFAALATLDGSPPADESELVRLFAGRADQAMRARDRVLLVAALRDFDQAAIFTIHAFCQRVLAEHALQTELPFTLELAEHDAALLGDIAADYWSRLTFAASRALVDALRARAVGPDALAKLARMTVRDDGVRVLPSPPPPPLDPEHERRFVEARARAAALWIEHRDELLRVLRTSDSLSRNKYQLPSIEKWALALDALAAWGPKLTKFASRLTPAGLEDGTRKGKRFDAGHPFYAAMQRLWDAGVLLRAAGEAAVLRARRELVDHARVALARQHQERGELGFDDLLQALARALAGPSGDVLARTLAERMPAALIDEFQDTDPVQYGIFRRIYAGPSTCLCLIGDPKQAIYGFRGADVLAYVQAARDAKDSAFTLGVNWRSDPSFVRAIEVLYARAPRPFVLDSIGFVPVKPAPKAHDRLSGDGDRALQLLFIPSADPRTEEKPLLTKTWADEALPRCVAGEVTALLRSGARIDGRPVTPADIAVLCRRNDQARATQSALSGLRVPTVLDGDRSVFESDTAVDLGRVLAAIAAPTDGRRLAAALLGPMLGVSPEDLLEMVGHDDGFEPWLERLARWSELWRERGFVRMFQALLDQGRVQQNLLAALDGERRLTDLLHLGELLHETSSRERLGPEALLGWLSQRRHKSSRDEFATESAQLRLEHDEQALRLTTVHRSKGLEYPIVFCPFGWGSVWKARDLARFHDDAAGGAPSLDLGSSDFARHALAAIHEAAAEDARLLYVALTRARHRSYVVWGRFREAGSSALALLLHAPPGMTDRLAVEARYDEMSTAQQLSELRELATASGGTIGVRELGLDPPVAYAGSEHVGAPLAARRAQRTLLPSPRATSFSRLVAAQAEADAAREDDARDVDAQAADGPLVAEPGEALPLLAPAKVVLHDFPAGPGPGTLVHAIYERIDFASADVAAVRGVAEPLVASFGLRGSVRLDALAEGLVQTLDTPLAAATGGGAALRLRQIARADRLNELEFTLCTPHAGRRLSARALADALERTRALPDCPGYYARLGALPSVLAAQHVKGFVDLVFRQDGRYYVADYKSNKLGAHAADYGRQAVLDAMSEHHYFLQGYLYALALHRYLQRKLDGYDFERCFGGVAYLFVRGMAPSHAPGTAVWLDRPSLATLEALGEALGEPSREGPRAP